MEIQSNTETAENCRRILLNLGFCAHHSGYKQLKIGIVRYSLDDQQCLDSELYPYIVKELNCIDEEAVERSIGRSIAFAWNHGDREKWEQYFPGCKKTPSNKRFIATIAEFVI